MTSRERVIAAIERKPLDRVPRYEGFWEDALARWQTEGMVLPPVPAIVVEGKEKQIGSPVDAYFGFDFAPLYMDVSVLGNTRYWRGFPFSKSISNIFFPE